jgi:CRISPR/Cas system-associated endonuclease/helicase Cas3
MLESLFASQGPPCRKLHRLAKSVLLFDEVQTLPLGLAIPALATLSQLSARFGSTVLFSTATQPAFNVLDEKVRTMALSGWTPKEIIPKAMDLFKIAPRFRCHWPEKGQEGLEKLPWENLTDAMLNAPNGQAMCVVNLKKHALHLHDLLKKAEAKGLFHLSTSMCGLHRKDRLDEIRAALKHSKPCLLVATQCVEAGVDLDFPAVWRAWGPLDSIAQAAGRCNRHGRMAEGTMTVFHPEEEGYPDHGYERAAAVARMIFAQYGAEAMDLSDTALFEKYCSVQQRMSPFRGVNRLTRP